jgi:hypothetical protein
MWQAVIAYLIVAGAASWVAWSLFLPRGWRMAGRARLQAMLGRAPVTRTGGCGDCQCGAPKP